MRKKQFVYLSLPYIESMLTGVYMISQPIGGGPITLTYTDGETESADINVILDENSPIFGLIGDIQDCARKRGQWKE